MILPATYHILVCASDAGLQLLHNGDMDVMLSQINVSCNSNSFGACDLHLVGPLL